LELSEIKRSGKSADGAPGLWQAVKKAQQQLLTVYSKGSCVAGILGHPQLNLGQFPTIDLAVTLKPVPESS
jgi:hypothetical protein